MINLLPFVVYPIAGHHDKDSGAIGSGYKEADLTKRLRNNTSFYLKERNHKHIMDNDWETNTQLQSRIKPGSGSVLLDHHFNSTTNTTTKGCEVIVADNANANSIAFAKELVDGVSKILGTNNRGVRKESETPRKRLGILHKGAGIAALLEVEFISNPTAMAIYISKEKEVAKFIAEICIKYDNMIV